ncbi:MAG: hypothetical protein GY822_16135 [Deltaproteobacteria bacterium]|nr:hypothetical protein [Deltaproteobacteria bacterium]
MIHELGHFVGVDHPCVDCGWSIMAATSGFSDLEQPAPVDRSAVSALYPGVPGGLGYGCDNANDCVAAPFCATVGDLSYCTQSCGNCPTGYACESISGEGDICVFSSGSLAPPVGRGETCNPTPCEEGLECLQFQQDTTEGECVAFCTPSASTNPECNEYEDCLSVTQDDSLGACIPLYGDVVVGGVCNFEEILCQRGGLCLIATEGATEGECYAECNPEATTNPSCGENDECFSVSSTDPTFGACLLAYGDVEPGEVCGDDARMCLRGSTCLLVEEGADLGVCFSDCDTASGGCPGGYVCDEDLVLGGLCKAESCNDDESVCDDGYTCTYTSASRYACATGVEPGGGCSCDAQAPNQSAQSMWAGLLLLGLVQIRRSRK